MHGGKRLGGRPLAGGYGLSRLRDAGRRGTGPGLPLTRALVRLHDGTPVLQSEPGVGTTVTVRLPRRRLVSQSRDVA